MKIFRYRQHKKLTLSQVDYIKKVLHRFSIKNAKVVSTPLPSYLKLTKEMCPMTWEEEDNMSKVPYALVIGILMYVMACTRPDIADAMSHPGIEHWNAIK